MMFSGGDRTVATQAAQRLDGAVTSAPRFNRYSATGYTGRMKAALVEHLYAPVSIKEIPDPQPGPHEVLVAVTAAGVNPVDWKTRERGERRMPFVAGQDFAGLVVDVGAEVTKYHYGERVFGIAREHGTYAQYTIVPENDRPQPIAKIPDDVGDADAAALPTAGLTALATLDAAKVREGSTVLVLGATGGVGGFAVQIAKDRGARVIGTGKSDHEAIAREFGVDEFVAYDKENVVQRVKASTGTGVDAIVDLVDDADALKASAQALRDGGTIVSTIGAVDEAWCRQHGIDGQNLVMTDTPQSSPAGLTTLTHMIEQGRLRVRIVSEYPLDDAERALDQSKNGSVEGKLIVTI
jgi:NADPH:quinone reductase-like Zn-dependent oxidoreductase